MTISNQHLSPGPLPRLRRKFISVAIAGLATFSAAQAYATEDQEVTQLRQEIERLKQALTQSEQARAQEKSANPAEQTPEESATAPAAAQSAETAAEENNELDSLVVTARKKNPLETVKDKPTSVSIVGGQELDRFQATSMTDVLRRIGNVNFNYGNPRTGTLTLRGITTGSSDQIDPTVGVIIDGVSLAYSPLANGYIFTDIDTVDVTRGPQGTTGGKASNIGRITFKTNEPTFFPVAKVSQTFGEWHTLKTQAVVGGPIVDDLLAWRGSFVRDQQQGPFSDQFPDSDGRTSYQNTDRTFGRIQFLLTPTDGFRAKLSYELQPKGSEFVNGNTVRHPEPATFSNGAARPASQVNTAYNKYANRAYFNQDPAFYNPATDYYKYTTFTDNNGAIVTSSEGATANLYWDNILGHQVRSTTGWREHWFSASNDEGTPFDITKSGGYITKYDQVSQELHFNSLTAEDSFVDYQGGLLYLKTNNHSLGNRTRYGSDAGAFQASDTQYNALTSGIARNAAGQALAGGTGKDAGAAQAMLTDSLNNAYRSQDAYIRNNSIGLNGQADWHLSQPLTLTTGYAISHEERSATQGLLLLDQGGGGDFTTAFINGNDPTTSSTSLDAANRLAAKYFGANTTYSLLDANQKALLQNAAAIRNGTLQPTQLYGYRKAKPWTGIVQSGVITLTDKLSDNVSVYGSVQYGEKAGIAQISPSGVSSLIDKERTTGFEVGVKSALLDNNLILNANVFLNDIRNFQTTVATVDPVATAQYAAGGNCSGADCQAYTSQVGNVPRVRVSGLEVDASYYGIEHFNFRLAAAYNDARYAEDVYFAFPSERDTTGLAANQRFYNAKGDTLTFAPKFTSNLAVGYNLPVFGNKLFHIDANYKYTSSYGISTSAYDKVDAYGLLDLGIGIGRKDGLFDANLLVKNVFDKEYNPYGFASYTPTLPRWVGIVFSSKL